MDNGHPISQAECLHYCRSKLRVAKLRPDEENPKNIYPYRYNHSIKPMP